MKVGRKVPPHGGNGKQTGGNPIMRIHHKDGMKNHEHHIAGKGNSSLSHHNLVRKFIQCTARIRLEGAPYRYHEDHIAAKGMNSLSHFNLVHTVIPMPQAVKIPDAKAAVEK